MGFFFRFSLHSIQNSHLIANKWDLYPKIRFSTAWTSNICRPPPCFDKDIFASPLTNPCRRDILMTHQLASANRFQEHDHLLGYPCLFSSNLFLPLIPIFSRKTEPAQEKAQALFLCIFLSDWNILSKIYCAAFGCMAAARRCAKKNPATLAANTA